MPSTSLPHVLMFPFMAGGHILPLIDLSKALSGRQVKTSIITTSSNARNITQFIAGYPLINLIVIPFPAIDGLPEGCENTAQLPSLEFYPTFLNATQKLRAPFEQILQSLSDSKALPVCVISDFFLGWTLGSCRAFGVPRLVFHGMSVLSMTICKHVGEVLESHFKSASSSDPIDIPSLKLPFTLTAGDLPANFLLPKPEDDPVSQFIYETSEADINSWGVIVNSFEELEGSYVQSLDSCYTGDAKAWCVGPLFLHAQTEDESNTKTITTWLNRHAANPGSVIYAAFGTQADMPDSQLDEVAQGLEDSEIPFVWVVRSKTWSPPEGMEERLKAKGLIVREFADQRQILSHDAVGGFLSHCGWNSMLESVSTGVPLLCLPLIPISEQKLNAGFLVDGLAVGLAVERESEGGVTRKAVSEGVKELMVGERGRRARERVQELGRLARRAVRPGGSSHDALTKLITQLVASGSAVNSSGIGEN